MKDDDIQVKRHWPYSWVENEVLEDDALDTYDKLTYVMLCKFSNQEGTCFPSLSTLKKLIGCGKDRLIKSLNNLEKRGWIVKQNRQKEEGSSNLYFLPGKRLTSLPKRQGTSLPKRQASRPRRQPLVGHADTNDNHINDNHLTNKRTKKTRGDFERKPPSDKYEKFYL